MLELPELVKEFLGVMQKCDQATTAEKAQEHTAEFMRIMEKMEQCVETVKGLMLLLDSDDSDIRILAASCLSELGYEPALDYLQEVGDKEPDTWAGGWASTKLWDLKTRAAGREQPGPWDRMIRAKRRVAAMMELPEIVREYFELEAMQDEATQGGTSAEVRRYADRLCRLGEKIRQSEKTIRGFAPLLDSDEPEIRLTAACFLGEIGYEPAIAYLQDLANRRDFRAEVKLDDLKKRGRI